MTIHHETLVLTRDIDCPPARLFHLLTDADARAKWGAPDADSVIEIDHADIKPGGHEVSRCGPKDEPYFDTRTDFHVVTPDSLLLGSETLSVGGEMMSVALISHEVAAKGDGARLAITLQITSLTGPDTFEEYRGGWTGALDNLAALAKGAS